MYYIKRKAGIESHIEGYNLVVYTKGEFGHKKITRREIVGSGVSLKQLYTMGIGNGYLTNMSTKQVTYGQYQRIFSREVKHNE